MNPLPATTNKGTLGELYVQIRLLEHGIQAAPPLKDSGNDLIAVYQDEFRAVQVRSTTSDTIDKPADEKLYHVLAVVKFQQADHISIDTAELYLFSKSEVATITSNLSNHKNKKLSSERVQRLFK